MKLSQMLCICVLINQVYSYQQKMKIKKLDCSSDPLVCADPICKMTAVNRTFSKRFYGCTPVKPVDSLKLRLVHFKKTYTNHFRPGFFDITQDLCEIMRQGSTKLQFFKTFFDNVLPGTYAQMMKYMRPCPITEKMYIEMIQDERIVPMAAIIPPGEYKIHARIFTGKNETFFEANTYYILANNVCC